MKLLLFRLGEVNKVLSLFKNDLKQLKNVIVIFISCLLLNYLIGIMSFNKDIIRVMFYFSLFKWNYLFNYSYYNILLVNEIKLFRFIVIIDLCLL